MKEWRGCCIVRQQSDDWTRGVVGAVVVAMANREYL
jgi:hypothetical protein